MSKFDYEECYLKFDGEIFAIAENKKNAKVIGETLIQLFDENEQLKQDIRELQNDKLLTELQMKCDKKQEHIVLLEGKIHRMRDNIKRLEALYHYRGYIGSGDVKKEYYRMEKLLRAENDQLKQEVETLQEELAHFIGDVE